MHDASTDPAAPSPSPSASGHAARAAGIGCVAVETVGFSQCETGGADAVFVYQDVEETLD